MRLGLEVLVLELKLFKTKWLIIGIYKPWLLKDVAFPSEIRNILMFYRLSHDNIQLIADFEMAPNTSKLNELIEDHERCNLISESTCLKVLLVLTVFKLKKKIVLWKVTFEAGVLDRHKFIDTMIRSNKIFYRFYKNFGNQKFEKQLKKQSLSMKDFESFRLAFKFTLSQFASLKQKFVRNNKLLWENPSQTLRKK